MYPPPSCVETRHMWSWHTAGNQCLGIYGIYHFNNFQCHQRRKFNQNSDISVSVDDCLWSGNARHQHLSIDLILSDSVLQQQGWGLIIKLRSLSSNFSVGERFCKSTFFNHFHICQVPPQMSYVYGDTCRIWTWFSIGNQYFFHNGKIRKNNGTGEIGLVTPTPEWFIFCLLWYLPCSLQKPNMPTISWRKRDWAGLPVTTGIDLLAGMLTTVTGLCTCPCHGLEALSPYSIWSADGLGGVNA